MYKILSIAVVFAACVTHAAEPEKDARIAMVNLNSSFIAAHAVARKADLADGGPLVLLRSGHLVLLYKGQETSVKVFPPEYTTYKTFAHMPAAIFLQLESLGVGEINDERLAGLRSYRERMDHVLKNVDDIGLTGSALKRQKAMLTASKVFLDKVIAGKQVSQEALIKYARGMTPMIKANLAGAAKAQIDGMHRQMMIWKKEMTDDEWKQLRVAVKGAVLARKDNLAKQYFQALLGLTGECNRLVYMELYFPPTPMETLIATRSVDGELAVAFFDDPDRMYRDVLADAATAYLKTMKFD